MTPVAAVVARAVAAPAIASLAQKAVVLASGSSLPPVASMAPALLLRGGGAESAFDLTRAKIRLEGLHSYGVVATLMLNVSMRLFSSTPAARKSLVKGETATNAAKILFTAAIVGSVVSGLYTTIVFSMLGMYTKTAIGMGKDYIAFFDATQVIRENAFHSFIISLLSFNTSFILSLFLNYEGEMRWWVSGIAAALSVLSWWQWSSIMSIASQLIFS